MGGRFAYRGKTMDAFGDKVYACTSKPRIIHPSITFLPSPPNVETQETSQRNLERYLTLTICLISIIVHTYRVLASIHQLTQYTPSNPPPKHFPSLYIRSFSPPVPLPLPHRSLPKLSPTHLGGNHCLHHRVLRRSLVGVLDVWAPMGLIVWQSRLQD